MAKYMPPEARALEKTSGGPYCRAYNCHTSYYNHMFGTKKKSMFNFPANEERCREWVKNIGVQSLVGIPADKLSNGSYKVCQLHFEDWCFTSEHKRRLNWNAVPRIFDVPKSPSLTPKCPPPEIHIALSPAEHHKAKGFVTMDEVGSHSSPIEAERQPYSNMQPAVTEDLIKQSSQTEAEMLRQSYSNTQPAVSEDVIKQLSKAEAEMLRQSYSNTQPAVSEDVKQLSHAEAEMLRQSYSNTQPAVSEDVIKQLSKAEAEMLRQSYSNTQPAVSEDVKQLSQAEAEMLRQSYSNTQPAVHEYLIKQEPNIVISSYGSIVGYGKMMDRSNATTITVSDGCRQETIEIEEPMNEIIKGVYVDDIKKEREEDVLVKSENKEEQDKGITKEYTDNEMTGSNKNWTEGKIGIHRIPYIERGSEAGTQKTDIKAVVSSIETTQNVRKDKQHLCTNDIKKESEEDVRLETEMMGEHDKGITKGNTSDETTDSNENWTRGRCDIVIDLTEMTEEHDIGITGTKASTIDVMTNSHENSTEGRIDIDMTEMTEERDKEITNEKTNDKMTDNNENWTRGRSYIDLTDLTEECDKEITTENTSDEMTDSNENWMEGWNRIPHMERANDAATQTDISTVINSSKTGRDMRKEKPHLCTVCGKSFAQKYDLKKHSFTHSSKKSLLCSVCGKKFSNRNYFRKHCLLHTEENPTLCTVCGKSFASIDYLKRHQLLHKPDGEKPNLTCMFCGRSYSTKGNLKTHMLQHGEEKTPFSCKECGSKFASQYYYRKHLERHTEENPHLCTICGKSFCTGTYLKKHKLLHAS